jgi:histone acetyltransferase (RNA polymerase elongator complex component)
MNYRHIVIPIFVPHKGCPFDCIYCNQKAISGQIEEMTEDRMIQIIEQHLDSIKEGTCVEIGFYGGSFTGIERSQQIEFLRTANKYVEKGMVKSIRLSTRPDYINSEILDYLKFYNVKTIELGVQSLDEDVLRKSCRGHNVDDVITSSQLIKKYQINLGIQTMIGLPGSTKEKDYSTAQKVVQLKPQIVRIYPTLVIKNTYLERLYLDGRYTPLELKDAVDLCAELLNLYENHNIRVIRIGLQPTESINENSDVAAGPFHPAFRQLVESKLMLNRMESIICENGFEHEKHLVIRTGRRNISNVIGQKKAKINYLKKKYGFVSIKVEEDDVLNNKLFVLKL